MDGTKVSFGNRKAWVLCNLSRTAQIDLVAEGLPVILASAQGFWNAAQQLKEHGRAARVIEGFAEEEAAKILILMDLVRCPARRATARTSHLVKLFYGHLSRLLYAEAQAWKPVHVTQLREYVDNSRQGHYLEGSMGEYIVPNWNRYSRESALYADIEVHEDDTPVWNNPNNYSTFSMNFRPISLRIAEAMQAAGMFTRRGLQAVADIWGQLEFVDVQDHHDARELTETLFKRLDDEGQVTEEATPAHAGLLLNDWQLPMYNLEFSELPVSLEALRASQDAYLWSEIGHPSDFY